MRTVIILMALAFCAVAQDERKDAENCKDFPLISRYPGSIINSCEHKEFDSYSMPASRNKDGDPVDKAFEGEVWSWDVATREGLSALQVYRNFLNALKAAHWTIDYEESPDRFTAHKGEYQIDLQSRGEYYYLYAVKVGQMKQELTADATALGAAIDQSGRVAVYGIEFDTAKAAILPASEPVLAEVLKLMESRPDLKLRVEGHTDNVGTAASNQALSQKRAAAVAAWLVAHGVDGDRLTSAGFGSTKPTADNSTEEGRAKNRRVELAKQ